jgi:hypothetical protein
MAQLLRSQSGFELRLRGRRGLSPRSHLTKASIVPLVVLFL